MDKGNIDSMAAPYGASNEDKNLLEIVDLLPNDKGFEQVMQEHNRIRKMLAQSTQVVQG